MWLSSFPTSFQSLMNFVLKEYLRKFILVFFNDVLIYNPCWESHLSHLQKVLQTMRENILYAKLSKCHFSIFKAEYLGHYISRKGVETDPKKIDTILQWPLSKSQKDPRSFLGLTSYYRRFIKGYALICRPLIDLLRKNGFNWHEEATAVFNAVKIAMTTTPVIALPDFDLPFEVENDASSKGIRAVLHQNKHPIAFISKKLGPKWASLSVYKKELVAIMLEFRNRSNISWESLLLSRYIRRV